MPLVIWLATAFGTAIAFLTTYIGKKTAMVLASIVSLGVVILAFKTATDAAITGVAAVVPTGAFLFGLGLLPNNTGTCISAIATTYFAAIVYRYYVNIIDFSLKG